MYVHDHSIVLKWFDSQCQFSKNELALYLMEIEKGTTYLSTKQVLACEISFPWIAATNGGSWHFLSRCFERVSTLSDWCAKRTIPDLRAGFT